MDTETVKRKVTLPKAAQAPIVYATLMLALMGQMLLNPLIAPLARELGMKEWHMGAAISLAAIMLALTSPFWGKASQRHGAKKILLISMTIAMLALACVATISGLGMRGIWVGPSMVIAFLIARGVIYGSAISAVSPTVQTHLVTHTEDEPQRVKAVGGIGASTTISMVLGTVLGGVLAATGGLMLPLIAMPLMMLFGIIVLAVLFQPEDTLAAPARPTTISYFDPRVFPFLISGLMIYLMFASISTLLGFIIQDRFSLPSEQTVSVTAIYMVLMSIMLVFAQAGLAAKLGWNSVQLLRRGLLLTLIGVALFLPGHSYILFGLATVLFGLEVGLAVPGYTAGPTMELSPQEQGSLAGLVNSNNGIAFAVAPVSATALYGVHPLLPLSVTIGLLAVASLLSFSHPKLRELAKR